MFASGLQPGQFVSFTYTPPAVRAPRARGGIQPPPSDPHKQIMVLNPNWQGKVHSLDLKRITPAEVQVLKAVMDPENKRTFDQTGQLPEGAPEYSLVLDVFRRMDPVQLIRNPIAFYAQFVKPFMRDKDAYRQYWPQFMSGLTVITETQVRGGTFNPKPLFKK